MTDKKYLIFEIELTLETRSTLFNGVNYETILVAAEDENSAVETAVRHFESIKIPGCSIVSVKETVKDVREFIATEGLFR